jgi:hypothetical protein
MPDPANIEVASAAFACALKAYVEDESDRHIRQQIESFSFEWKQTPAVEAAVLSFDPIAFHGVVPSHVIAGTLYWKGDYVQLELFVKCFWEGTNKNGSIHFVVDVVKGSFIDEPRATQKAATKEVNAAKRIRQKMIARLSKDDYVMKLISTRQNLIEASVKIQDDELEERVCCEEITAQAIHRSIFTTASPLDVFQFVLSLPFLPTRAHENNITAVTALADRVKLRCLEEATVEACEQEEEDELVNELQISKKPKSSD